jgi:Fur family peroxide stress response transcriptional regulator
MRYDAFLESHHHLYCSDSDRIEDYLDNELNKILENYFEKKRIPGFKIEDIKLQIIGKFLKNRQ